MAAAEGGGGQVAFSRLVSYSSGSEMPVSRLSYTTSGTGSYSSRRPGAALYPARSASLDRGPLASSISSRYRPSALTTASSSSRRPPACSTLQRRRCDSSGSTRLPGLDGLGPVTEARRYLNERRALDNHPDTYRQQRYTRSESRDAGVAAAGADRVAERVRSFEAARSGLERLVPITLETDDGASVVSERERRPSVTELRQKFDQSDPLATRADVKPSLTNGHATHAVTSAEDAVKTAATSRFGKSSCVGSQGLSVSGSTVKPSVSKYGRVSTVPGSSPESDDRSPTWSSSAVESRPLRRTVDPDPGWETSRGSGEAASYRPTVLQTTEGKSDAMLPSSFSRTAVTSPADPLDAGRLRALDSVDARSETSALTNGHGKCRRLTGSTVTNGGDATVRSPTSSLNRTRLAFKDTATSNGSKTSPGAAASVKDVSPDVASSPAASITNGERLSVTRRDPVRETSSSETSSSLSDTNSCGGSPTSKKRMVMSSGLEASRRPTERIRGGRTSSSQHLLLPVVSLTEASTTAEIDSSAENGKISGSSAACESDSASARRPVVTSLQQSAVAAVTREDSDSQQSSDRRRHGLTGLRNIGNTCFMNSVLQCLSNTAALHPYILQREFEADINTVKSSMQGALVKAFAELVGDLWRDDSEHLETCRALTTAPFKAEIQRFAPRFMGYQQQDAQEFLRYLLEGLHEDVNRVRERPRPMTTDIDDALSDTQKAMESWKRFLRCENSKFVDLFVGQLKSTLRCVECGHESVTFDPFWDLSLPIPCRAGGSQVRLQACFDLFTSQETLDGDEKPTCSQCEKRQKCTKRFSIQRFPRILVVHLKRFNPAEKYRGKLNSPIDLPLCGLDLSHYSSGPGPCRYNLYGVANHSGTLYSGHYTACCRHPYSGQWHEYNDSRVNSVSVGSVVTKEAYVLFFELADSAQR